MMRATIARKASAFVWVLCAGLCMDPSLAVAAGSAQSPSGQGAPSVEGFSAYTYQLGRAAEPLELDYKAIKNAFAFGTGVWLPPGRRWLVSLAPPTGRMVPVKMPRRIGELQKLLEAMAWNDEYHFGGRAGRYHAILLYRSVTDGDETCLVMEGPVYQPKAGSDRCVMDARQYPIRLRTPAGERLILKAFLGHCHPFTAGLFRTPTRGDLAVLDGLGTSSGQLYSLIAWKFRDWPKCFMFDAEKTHTGTNPELGLESLFRQGLE